MTVQLKNVPFCFRRCVQSAWTEGKTLYSCAATAHVSCAETECRSVPCVANPWKDEFCFFNKITLFQTGDTFYLFNTNWKRKCKYLYDEIQGKIAGELL